MFEEAPRINPTATDEAPWGRLAEDLGFASYLDLFESSTPLASDGRKAWMLTHLHGTLWVLWNDRDLEVEGRYESKQDALAELAGRVRPIRQQLTED